MDDGDRVRNNYRGNKTYPINNRFIAIFVAERYTRRANKKKSWKQKNGLSDA